MSIHCTILLNSNTDDMTAVMITQDVSIRKKRIVHCQDAVEYLGLELTAVGLETNTYYKACNILVFCDG